MALREMPHHSQSASYFNDILTFPNCKCRIINKYFYAYLYYFPINLYLFPVKSFLNVLFCVFSTQDLLMKFAPTNPILHAPLCIHNTPQSNSFDGIRLDKNILYGIIYLDKLMNERVYYYEATAGRNTDPRRSRGF